MCNKSKNETKVSIEMLSECVDYDKETGVLSWRMRPEEHFTSKKSAAVWNAKFAGKEVKKRSHGYVVVVITESQKESYCMGHRAAWAITTGNWPDGEIDHINGDRCDNRYSNLRVASHTENQRNKSIGAANRSGFKGVHKHSQNGNWIAQIRANKRTVHLGTFQSAEAASMAYQKAALAEHGAFFRSPA